MVCANPVTIMNMNYTVVLQLDQPGIRSFKHGVVRHFNTIVVVTALMVSVVVRWYAVCIVIAERHGCWMTPAVE